MLWVVLSVTSASWPQKSYGTDFHVVHEDSILQHLFVFLMHIFRCFFVVVRVLKTIVITCRNMNQPIILRFFPINFTEISFMSPRKFVTHSHRAMTIDVPYSACCLVLIHRDEILKCPYILYWLWINLVHWTRINGSIFRIAEAFKYNKYIELHLWLRKIVLQYNTLFSL